MFSGCHVVPVMRFPYAFLSFRGLPQPLARFFLFLLPVPSSARAGWGLAPGSPDLLGSWCSHHHSQAPSTWPQTLRSSQLHTLLLCDTQPHMPRPRGSPSCHHPCLNPTTMMLAGAHLWSMSVPETSSTSHGGSACGATADNCNHTRLHVHVSMSEQSVSTAQRGRSRCFLEREP